jgi:hypothetical protein
MIRFLRKIDRALTRVDIATRATVETIALIVGLVFFFGLPAFMIWCWITG